MAKTAVTNKSAFVRSLPADMPREEVVAKAKEQGLTMTEQYVSTIRSLAKAKSAPMAPKRRGRPPKASVPFQHAPKGTSFEAELATLVIDHGFRSIEQALAAIRTRLQRSVS